MPEISASKLAVSCALICLRCEALAESELKPHPDAVANTHAPGEVDKPELVPFIVRNPRQLPGIVIDETEATLVGKWQYSTHTPPYVGLGYLHDQKTNKGESSVTFTPDLPKAGRYEVRLSHCYNVRRSTNTPVTIHHADGEQTVRINQQDIPKHNKLFRSMGTFRFRAGRNGWVRISTAGTNGKYVIADAVQFIPMKNDMQQVATPPEKPRLPNIVYILADDLGWSDLRCYGHAYHKTPNIDRLAATGVRFTNGYASAPICSASRASILTGKSPARLGFEFVTKHEAGHQKIDSEVPLKTPSITLNLSTAEATIAERLAVFGYQTTFFGKWHVNQHYQRRYLAWHPEFGPKQQGFAVAVEDFGDHPYAWRKKPVPDLPDGQFPADSMINRTADFIRSQGISDRPYFLMVSSFYVHTPVKNRCRWLVNQYEPHLVANAVNRKKRLEYAAFVETLDHHVGTILDAIDQSGKRDNTLVFFMSDNGGHPEYCSNAPLRGSKWNLYEGGVRVPMIARWPIKIPAGVTCDAPVIGYDLLPTFVDVAGDKVAETDRIDGISFKSAFTNQNWRPERSLIWHFPYYHPETTFSKAIDEIGVNDFITSKTRPQSAIRRGPHKLIQFAEDDRVELYDLSRDISEQNDLSLRQPRVAAELRDILQRKLNSMNARFAVPMRE